MNKVIKQFKECDIRLYFPDDAAIDKQAVTSLLPILEPVNHTFSLTAFVSDEQRQMVVRYYTIPGIIVFQF